MSDDQTHTIAAAVERDVVRVAGPDAETFLQGQLSQDVTALAVNTSTWTFLLHPQGKVHSWMRITKTAADTFLLDVDGGYGDAVVERLRRFLIRTDATIEALEWSCVSVRGTDVARTELADGVLRLALARPVSDASHDAGYDLIGPDAAALDAAVPDGVTAGSPADVDARRILAGVPAMGAELTDDTIPAEVGQWIVDVSVSFTKGCYVGQELVARIDSRGGNVPRHLRALVADADIAVGDTVDADGPSSVVTSLATTPDGPVALAFVSRKAGVGDTVSVGGVRAVVHELPLCGSAGS